MRQTYKHMLATILTSCTVWLPASHLTITRTCSFFLLSVYLVRITLVFIYYIPLPHYTTLHWEQKHVSETMTVKNRENKDGTLTKKRILCQRETTSCLPQHIVKRDFISTKHANFSEDSLYNSWLTGKSRRETSCPFSELSSWKKSVSETATSGVAMQWLTSWVDEEMEWGRTI